MSAFKNRVFGCAIVKAINANYNADFTHQPRTLPDGTVYATDKAFKYSIRNYLTDQYPDEKVFFYKRFNESMVPLTLADTYTHVFDEFGKAQRPEVLRNLLSCIDIKFFGATFAAKEGKVTINLSIHGPVQVNHGINRFPNNEIYSEQIMSPFRNPKDKPDGSKEDQATTLGQQSKLREGHYVHHFSINPKNLEDVRALINDAPGITVNDINLLKEAMRCGVSYFDSAAKAGTDNEVLLWVQLKPESKKVLPVFTEFITIERQDGKTAIDFGGLNDLLSKVNNDIESIEVHYIPEQTTINNLPASTKHINLATEEVI